MRLCGRQVVMGLAVIVLTASSAGVSGAAEPFWRESASAPPPADIARLNDFMNGLTERLKPSLLHQLWARHAPSA